MRENADKRYWPGFPRMKVKAEHQGVKGPFDALLDGYAVKRGCPRSSRAEFVLQGLEVPKEPKAKKEFRELVESGRHVEAVYGREVLNLKSKKAVREREPLEFVFADVAKKYRSGFCD